MGVRDAEREILDRLSRKSLDSRFVREIRDGLNCSAFEAEAVLGVVQEVYGSYLDGGAPSGRPGTVSLVVVSAEERSGKPLSECEMQTVCLNLHRGSEDDRVLQQEGPTAWRRSRIPDLCQEALSQGGVLTREDLAYRVFFVSVRTISRDLRALREQWPELVLPLRSQRQDIGPVLSHRTQIVRLALEGKTTSEICQIMHHSASAVGNYLSTFTRCAQLHRQGLQEGQIAFLLRRGRTLVRQYIELLASSEGETNRQYHLEELLRLGSGSWGEKEAGGECG